MIGAIPTGATAAAYAALAVLTLCCCVAGWLDLTQRRIPNWLCGVTALAGLGAALLLGGSLASFGSHVLHMVVALLGGMALFALRIFGGGDAKFYAAVAAWFAFGMGVLLLIDVALCGLVLLIGWFTWRRLRGLPIRRPQQGGSNHDGLPYGIAIGAGAVVTMLMGMSP